MKKWACLFLGLIQLIACTNKKELEENTTISRSEAYQFEAIADLTSQPTLPSLMVNRFGDSINSVSAWEENKPYIKEMLTFYQYGEMPPVPTNVSVIETSSKLVEGKIHKSYNFTISNNGKSLTFRVGMMVPTGEGPYPIIIKNDRYRFDLNEIINEKARKKYTKQDRLSLDFLVADKLVDRRYIYCKFNREDIALDEKETRSSGIFNLYPEYNWGTVSAWAWTYQIIIDWLVKQPFIDKEKIVVTGHSRGGKTALCAGIFDERIAITAPNSSGLGGTASLRFYDFSNNPEVQKIEHHIERFPYWWTERWYQLANHIEKIPFDAHFSKALIAPRALFNAHARHDFWANPYGTYLTYLHAQPLFDLYGVPNHQSIHWRDGGHAQNEEDWAALLDYCDMIFYKKESDRTFNQNPHPDKYDYEILETHDITKQNVSQLH